MAGACVFLLAVFVDARLRCCVFRQLTNEKIPTPTLYPGARTIYATAMAVALKRSQLPYDGYEFIAGLVRALDVPDAGHKVRLMPPAYVKRQKNDATDAEAICEAVGRPNMRFVETKAPEQQGCLTLHRTRHLFIRQQTSVINAIRAHLAEFGIVAPVGCRGVDQLLAVVADTSDKRLPE